MIELSCQNPKCLKKFYYNGKKKKKLDKITCPKCHYKYPLWKLRTKNQVNNSVSNSKNTQIKNPPKSEKVRQVEKNINLLVEKNSQTERTTLPHSQFIHTVDGGVILETKETDSEEIKEPEIPEPKECSKICQEHNLPADYDSYYQKWMCKKCHTQDGSNRKNEQSNSESSVITPFNRPGVSNQKIVSKDKSESYKSEEKLPSFPLENKEEYEEIPVFDEFGNVEKVIKTKKEELIG